MGYGENLKKAIEQKRTSVYRLARETGIKPTTLYSCIQRDSQLSLENAIRLADALDINIQDLCDTSDLPDAGSLFFPSGHKPNRRPGVEYLNDEIGWDTISEIESKVVPLLLNRPTLMLDRYLIPLLESFLVLNDRGMEILVEVAKGLQSTHVDHMREDFLDEAKHGVYTGDQVFEYYREQHLKNMAKKTD